MCCIKDRINKHVSCTYLMRFHNLLPGCTLNRFNRSAANIYFRPVAFPHAGILSKTVKMVKKETHSKTLKS